MIKTHPLRFTLIVTLLSLYCLPAQGKTYSLKQARGHILEVTQEEFEKGTISEQIADKIFELMDALAQFSPMLKNYEIEDHIYTMPEVFGFANECHNLRSKDKRSSPTYY